jgi:2,3-bisphosphoglycerate-independent phosphoglycerate mutase
MPAVLVFIDGLGIGDRDPAYNPLARSATLLSQFNDGTGAPLPAGGRMVALDATLGTAGRPQSATGQTTLLTGRNASAMLGRHLLGYPNAALRQLLTDESIFRRLGESGARFTFANGYPVVYLQALHLPYVGQTDPFTDLPARWARRLRPAAAPFAFAAAGGRLATFDEVRSGLALCHDLTNRAARERGSDLPLRTPQEAAGVISRLSAQADFVMFDYFLTDEAGHLQDFELAERALTNLDLFLRALLALLPLARTSLFVTSDHGNLEDLRRRNHTLANVPLLLFGPASDWTDVLPLVTRLDQVAPLLLRASVS